MLGESHDLLHDFPDLGPKIMDLRSKDPEFARMMNEYENLDAHIRQTEELGSPVTDQAIEELKMNRMRLKDNLYQRLTA